MNTLITYIFTYSPLKFFVQSIWRDEAFSFLLAKQPILTILSSTASDFNPPLYYVLLHFWINIFGSSEIALRTLSFIFFLGTLYIVGMFLLHIYKVQIKHTLLYLVLFLVNPVLHYYAFEARMYSMFAFLAALSFYFLVTKSYRKYAITTILALYTHYFMFFALLGQMIYVYFVERKNMKPYMVMYLKMICYVIPWLLYVFFVKPPFNQHFWIPKLDFLTFINIPGHLFTGYEYFLGFNFDYLIIFSLIIMIIIAGSYYFLVTKSRRRMHGNVNLHVFFLSWVMIPTIAIVLFSLFKPIFLPRYMIFVTLGILLWLIFLIRVLPRQIQITSFVLLFICSLLYAQIQSVARGKADIKTPLISIKHLMKPNDVLYVTHEFNFHPAQYYVGEKKVFIYGKTYKDIPSFVGKVLIQENKITNTLPLFPARAFILKDDLSYSIQALY